VKTMNDSSFSAWDNEHTKSLLIVYKISNKNAR